MQRSVSIDYLKVLLAAGVVLGHALLIHGVVTTGNYLLGMAFLRGLVPSFAVVSGYCFYTTYRRGRVSGWLTGLVLGYLFWTLFYAPIWVTADTGWRDVIGALVWGNMHLWYIAGLIVAALLIAGLVGFGARTGRGLRPLLIMAGVLGLAGSVLTYWSFYWKADLPLEYMRNGFTVIFPFAAMGFALAARVGRLGRDCLPRAGVLWALVALLFGARLIEAYYAMQTYGLSIDVPPENPLFAFATPVVLFLAFLRLDLPEVSVNLSGWSASIYFLHLFVILFIRQIGGIDSPALSLIAGIGLPILASIALDRVRGWAFPRLRGWLRARPDIERDEEARPGDAYR